MVSAGFAGPSKMRSGFMNVSKAGFARTYVSGELTTRYRNELMKYDKMRQVILDSFKIHLDRFKHRQFDDLENEFNPSEAVRLGQLLVGDSLSTFSSTDIALFENSKTLFTAYKSANPVFSDYKSFMFLLVDGMNSAITLSNENEQLLRANTDLETYKDILTNVEKLKTYIFDTYTHTLGTLMSFATEFTVQTGMVIHPEYLIYLEMYGAPEFGVFDSEKLNRIIRDM